MLADFVIPKRIKKETNKNFLVELDLNVMGQGGTSNLIQM
jgi:hypothetical protein